MKINNKQSGFTIVELLVVIVVIGILAAITIVAYSGISNRAIVSSLQSDLTNASQQLKLYSQIYSSYPTALNASYCPTAPTVDNTYCLKPSSGNTLTYNLNTATNPQTFSLTATNTNSSTSYGINNTSSPVALAQPSDCPTGFIPVPGSATYGQAGFCTMKYEASQVGTTTVPISSAGTLPWVNISQTTAVTNSQNVAGCTGCHLITEAEWMTLAQNVLSVPSNWSGGSVGSGYIYGGHNDNVPANALAPVANDTDGYNGTGNSASSGANQKRTLTLTNGEIIWDLAGNVREWTQGTSTTGQPGITGEATYAWKQWTSANAPGSLTPSPFPSSTGLAGSSSWNSGYGVGNLYSYPGETGLRGFVRGGHWSDSNAAGVLALVLPYSPDSTSSAIGFRVSR